VYTPVSWPCTSLPSAASSTTAFFFFQAEDGIRYRNVTGVQTCALPICQWQRYTNLADIVIISGAKALNGPTSGIIAGKKDLITAVRAHQFGIGRAMKVGKEAVLGLVRAVEEYPDN